MELEKMQKDQLKAEATRRKLTTSGTNEELIDRIRQYDLDNEDDPIGDDYVSKPEETVVEVEADEPAKKKETSFITMFPCPGELSTGVHQEYCDRTIARAQAEGHEIRGVAHRIDFTNKDGKRYAVYEVHLAREHSARRY
jgi:hypothetical protein